MYIRPEPEWEGLIASLKRQKGTALLIGATDSGKSTLAKYLVEKLLKENIKISIVDADVGQSTLGPPATITMKVFLNEKDIKSLDFDKMFFVGSINPAEKVTTMIEGSKKMVDLCRGRSEVIIVDTTGLVSGEIGKELKIGKIRAIRPEYIIAIQRSNELEHIINHIEDVFIYRIKASSSAKFRDREARLNYRKKKFFDYFDEKETSEFLLNYNDVKFFYNNRQVVLREGDFKKGTIIGLNHNDDTLGLGVIIEISDKEVFFKSPLRSLHGVNRVLFSDIEI